MLILAFFQVFRCIEYPGLYYDAVNPDYMAVQLLYPQVENPLWIVPHTGLPLLGQLYHGTFTAWVQALVIGLTGNASLWTIRTVNMAYIVGICWFCYRVGKWANIQKGILYSGIAVITLIRCRLSEICERAPSATLIRLCPSSPFLEPWS